MTVQGMMATWLGTVAGLEQSTLDSYRQEVRQVNLTFGPRLASTVRPSEVRAWAARAHPGASIRRRSLVSMRRAYKLAIADGLLTEDPNVVWNRRAEQSGVSPRELVRDYVTRSSRAPSHHADAPARPSITRVSEGRYALG